MPNQIRSLPGTRTFTETMPGYSAIPTDRSRRSLVPGHEHGQAHAIGATEGGFVTDVELRWRATDSKRARPRARAGTRHQRDTGWLRHGRRTAVAADRLRAGTATGRHTPSARHRVAFSQASGCVCLRRQGAKSHRPSHRTNHLHGTRGSLRCGRRTTVTTVGRMAVRRCDSGGIGAAVDRRRYVRAASGRSRPAGSIDGVGPIG